MERPVNINYKINQLIDNVEKVIVGKRPVIELVVASMLAGGHVLIEDVPGVGKTQMVASLASSCGGVYNRLQLTPDILPSDITGFNLIDQNTKEMRFHPGVAFCNFLLADEINRSSPKTQSALLEIMEECQVSIDGVSYKLEEPFMVLATQNPVETSGTYQLPEAQMDRFLMRLSVGYPSKEEELAIFHRAADATPKALTQVISTGDIMELRGMVEKVTCSEELERYIIAIANATRNNEGIRLGISPRGSLAIRSAAKAYAFCQGRDYCLPDDIKYLAPYVLAHRIILTPKGKSMWGNEEEALKSILREVSVVQ
ncbi:MAG: AAA family ATPase [Lachnospira sp.]